MRVNSSFMFGIALLTGCGCSSDVRGKPEGMTFFDKNEPGPVERVLLVTTESGRKLESFDASPRLTVPYDIDRTEIEVGVIDEQGFQWYLVAVVGREQLAQRTFELPLVSRGTDPGTARIAVGQLPDHVRRVNEGTVLVELGRNSLHATVKSLDPDAAGTATGLLSVFCTVPPETLPEGLDASLETSYCSEFRDLLDPSE